MELKELHSCESFQAEKQQLNGDRKKKKKKNSLSVEEQDRTVRRVSSLMGSCKKSRGIIKK